MVKLIVATLIMVLFSCTEVKKQIDPVKLPLKSENLQGSWQFFKAANPSFKINQQKIQFLEDENQSEFDYSIHGDSIIIHFPTYDYAYRVLLYEGDSLKFIDEANVNTYFKVN
ncbi:MAG: hypothetical protein M3Q56_12545 [Bacteroidota bacterium]|nr:hypothetical protein [Bacteroidota bacterium]